MNHNLFAIASLPFLAACFAESGIYAWNRGPGRGGRIVISQVPEAANLGMQIE